MRGLIEESDASLDFFPAFSIASELPFKSYTRKNIGYLYAISQGAEWIYDTDDDNKPYDKRTDMSCDNFSSFQGLDSINLTMTNQFLGFGSERQ